MTRQRNTVRIVEGGRGRSGAAKAPERLYNHWKRWGEMVVSARIMEGPAAEAAERKTVMIDVSRHAHWFEHACASI